MGVYGNQFLHEAGLIIGFNHGSLSYIKDMAEGTQVDKNLGRRSRFLSWLGPNGHVFNTAWQAAIKTYYSMSAFIIKGIYFFFLQKSDIY